jgi:hypothetical protein
LNSTFSTLKVFTKYLVYAWPRVITTQWFNCTSNSWKKVFTKF